MADRLGVEFLDRAIPAAVAERAGLTEEAVGSVEGRFSRRADRLTSALARASNAMSGHEVERLDGDERGIRAEIEAFVVRARRSGGVVLGRGGAVVLADADGVLHVYLGGIREARVEATMEREGLDRGAAERSVDAHDRARRDYVRSAYGVDGDDPDLYHLMLDGPGLGVDACVELIVLAAGRGCLPSKVEHEEE